MSAEIEALRERVRRHPGGPEFPALADALRRAGELEEARRVALAGLEHAPDNVAGIVCLGLLLLELGEPEAAQREFSRVLENVPGRIADLEIAVGRAARELQPGAPAFDRELGVEELERAFDDARSEPDQMLSANDIAVKAMEQAIGGESSEDAPAHFSPHEHPTYATATMADLLERQGDRSAAAAIRASLAAGAELHEELDAAVVPAQSTAAEPAGSAEETLDRRQRILATLESWLQNVRRGAV